LFNELKRVLDLDSTLAREIPLDSQEVEETVENPIEEEVQEEQVKWQSYYSLEQIKKLSAGNSDFLDKMIQVFLEETPAQIKQMKQLLEDGDFYRVGRLAHKMKPTIDMFDMIHLKELIRELEAESKNEDIDVASIREKVNFTVDRLNKIIQDLEQKFRG
jgi:HPt (histidine-containing phosphotransfer) domain-containing protein